MSRHSITKTQQSENSTSNKSRHKPTNQRGLSTPTFDRRNYQEQQIGTPLSLSGEVSPLHQNFSQIPVLSNASYPVQAKLKIGQPNDKYEQEADRVAEQVMRRPDSKMDGSPLDDHATPQNGTVQRTCSTCAKEYKTAENRPVQSASLYPKCRTQGQGLIQTMPITPLVQTKSTTDVTPEMTPTINL